MSRFASQPLSRCCEHTKSLITCQYGDCACSRHFPSDELEGKVSADVRSFAPTCCSKSDRVQYSIYLSSLLFGVYHHYIIRSFAILVKLAAPN